MHRAPTLAFALIVLTGCASPTASLADRSGFEGLDRLLRANRFEPVTPPEEQLLPGTIVEAAAPGRRAVVLASPADVFPADAFPTGAPRAASSRAAFLNEWTYVGTTDGEAALSTLLGSDGELEAALRARGVSSYELTFGNATIERLTPASIEMNLDKVPSTCRRYIQEGRPVILEALTVESIDLAFEDAQARRVGVTADFMDKLGLTIAGRWNESSDGRLSREGSFVIGVLTREFVTKPKRDGGVSLHLPPPLEGRPDASLVVTDEDVEPNDSPATATVIAADTSIDGAVGFGDDREDWFAFRTERDGELSVSLENRMPRGTKNANLGVIRVFDESGQRAVATRRGPFGPGRQTKRPTTIAVSAGAWYFVKLIPAPHRNRHAARYRLRLELP